MNFSHISPHFSRPVDLKKEPLKEIQNLQFSKEKRSVSSNILEKSNQNSGFDELKTSKVSIFDIATQEKIQLEQV